MSDRQTIILLLTAIVLLASAAECAAVAWLARLPRRARLALLLCLLLAHALLLAAQPAHLALSNAIVFASAAAGAVVLGAGLRDRQALISFSIAASLADIVSFTLGPTRALLDRFGGATGTLVTYLALTIRWQGQRVPVMGIGDLVLLGVFWLSLRQLDYPAWIAWAVPALGLLAALAIGLAIGGVFGIPFMAAAVLALLFVERRGPFGRRGRAPLA